MHIPQGEWTADDLDRVPEEAGRCVKTTVERKQLVLDKPFPMTIDVDQLYRRGKR
ncbi:hypothetical protein [Cryptosporangium japonicum]|uniref:Uncharacterized protein n=1 Tax=Cryptosporangium japonicum TaxID=80872 RepID=A0ABP3EUZ9_9ACTN